MNNSDKYQKMKDISNVLSIAGLSLSLLSMDRHVINSKEKSTAMAVVGGALSAASFFNNMLYLGRYGEIEEPDEGKILAEHTKNMLIIPLIDALNIGYSLMDREQKTRIINNIKRVLFKRARCGLFVKMGSGDVPRVFSVQSWMTIPSFSVSSLYLFLMVTSVTPATSATSLWVLRSLHRIEEM